MAAASLDAGKAKNILRQVEFYFSDSNLPRDNFLKKSVQESEDGLVSLALICSFTRMRNYLELGELKPEEVPEETVVAVAETLRKSPSLKVSEDGKRIGRSTELSKPEDVIEQVDSRTIAASPLPHDIKIEDVESFFGQYAKVNSVRLPRHVADKKHFCGTSLIEFSEEEDAKKVLNESLIYAGAELEMIPKKDFDAERKRKWEEFERTRSDKNGSDGSYPKGLIVAFKLKSIATDRATSQSDQDMVTDKAEVCKTEEVPNSEGIVNVEGENKTSAEDNKEGKSLEDVDKEHVNKATEDQTQECEEKPTDDAPKENTDKVINDSLATDKNVITREDLKQVLKRFGTVKFIDYRMGEESGYIRFEDPDAAVKARALAVLSDEGGLPVKHCIAILEPLTGEAEKEYWSLLRGNQERVRENSGNNRGRGRNNRGRFDGKRHHRQSDSGHGRPNKSQKVGGGDE